MGKDTRQFGDDVEDPRQSVTLEDQRPRRPGRTPEEDEEEEDDEETRESNALWLAAKNIGSLEAYIQRTGGWIWALLIFVAVIVGLIFHFIASATVPWITPGNFFSGFSLAMLMPLLALLPLAAVQTLIRDPRSAYFPLFGIVVLGCLVLELIELVAVIVQTVNNFSPIGTVLTNLDVASATGIIAALVVCLIILVAYIPFLVAEVAILVSYGQAMGGSSRGKYTRAGF